MTKIPEDMAQRFNDLETRCAHYERIAEDLSDVIAAQGKTIERLTRMMRQLLERLDDAETDWFPSPRDTKPPPHY